MLRNKSKWLAPLPAIVSNAIIVPFVLLYAYGIEPLWFSFVTVTLGELISCGVLGMVAHKIVRDKIACIVNYH